MTAKALYELFEEMAASNDNVEAKRMFQEHVAGRACEQAQQMADEICDGYIPYPRDKEGKPWHIGDMTDKGVVYELRFHFQKTETLVGILLEDGEVAYFAAQEIERPGETVTDAQGVPFAANETVWDDKGEPYTVVNVCNGNKSLLLRRVDGSEFKSYAPSRLTNERPVFDAEGVRCVRSEEVWCTTTGEPCRIIDIDSSRRMCAVEWIGSDAFDSWLRADYITHSEPDSFERLRDDIVDHADSLESTPYQSLRALLLTIAERITVLMERAAR